MSVELWKDVPEYEGIYQVSNFGRVKRIKVRKGTAGGLLRPYLMSEGYLSVYLRNLGNDYRYAIHRLVANMFIPNPDNKPYVNHIDGNRSNNIHTNLEWVTESENVKHSHEYLDRIFSAYGENHKNSKRVAQYDKSDILIDVYGSANEAGRQTGIPFTNICRVCRNERKYAGGYYWKYVDIPITKEALIQLSPKKYNPYFDMGGYFKEGYEP